MEFTNVGTGKSYDLNPGKESHYSEIWWIKDSEGDTVLKGTDSGVVDFAKWKYRMNGVVTETNTDFAAYLGRQVHMNGEVLFNELGEISQAPGEFRIN
jgi:hypothetical protein